MKKQVNKLSLNKVTVNHLSTSEADVKGGFTTLPCVVTVIVTMLICPAVPAGSGKSGAEG